MPLYKVRVRLEKGDWEGEVVYLTKLSPEESFSRWKADAARSGVRIVGFDVKPARLIDRFLVFLGGRR